jgi:hypothetical protein
MIQCPSVFSVGSHIRDWNLFRDIILLYLSGLFRILVLRDDRDVSLHLHVSRVVDRIHRVFACLF